MLFAGAVGHSRAQEVASKDITITSLGDLINAKSFPKSDGGAQALGELVRGSDVTIANQETIFFDKEKFNGFAPGSPYILRGESELAQGLRALGIDMVSTANNHSNDWGIEGLKEMTALLDGECIVHSGDGDTLKEAQSPRFFQSGKGRVALIAAASTYKQGAKAQDAMPDVPARPGISGLRIREITIVTRDQMQHLRKLYPASPNSDELARSVDTPFGMPIEKIYRIGPAPGFRYEMNRFDRDAIIAAVREGKKQADYAVFTIHAHENTDGMEDAASGAPANFIAELSHSVIEAGADMVMAGGPHSMRGIEIFKGKPIFYGMAVFLFGGNVVLTQEQRTEQYGSAAEAKPDGQNPKDKAFRTPPG